MRAHGREPMRSTPVLEGHETAALEAETAPAGASAGFAHRAGAFFLHEFLEMLPPTIFFFVGFNLIVLTTNLIAIWGASAGCIAIAASTPKWRYAPNDLGCDIGVRG